MDSETFINMNTKKIPLDAIVVGAEANQYSEQVRLQTIEECAKHLESLAEKNNDLLIEERHILQEDTVEIWRNDIDFLRQLADELRKLASKP